VHRAPNHEVLALRMSCLAGRLKELRAFTSALVAADRDTALKSLDGAGALSSLDGCADRAALTERVALPADPQSRREIDRLRGRLAEARAQLGLSRNEAGLAIVDEVLAQGTKLKFPSLRAEALALRGELLDSQARAKDAESVLSEAIDIAYAAHDDWLVASAASSLADVDGYWLSRRREGHQWAGFARAAIVRLGGSDQLEAERLRVEAEIYVQEAKGKEAVATAERALQLTEKLRGVDSLAAAHLHGTLGSAYRVLDQLEQARVHAQKDLDLSIQLLGPEHPSLVKAYNTLGNITSDQEKYEEAEGYYRKSVEVAERTLGKDHPRVAVALCNLSTVLDGLKRHEESLAISRRALGILERKFGPDSEQLTEALQGIGMSLASLNRPAEAVPYLEWALRICEKEECSGRSLAGDQYFLGAVLYDAHRERGRALRLVTQARDYYQAQGRETADQLRDVQKWLDEHR
jgi:tetratricopeptide (TPR) repeat protein